MRFAHNCETKMPLILSMEKTVKKMLRNFNKAVLETMSIYKIFTLK